MFLMVKVMDLMVVQNQKRPLHTTFKKTLIQKKNKIVVIIEQYQIMCFIFITIEVQHSLIQ